jgi:hypothetical protein
MDCMFILRNLVILLGPWANGILYLVQHTREGSRVLWVVSVYLHPLNYIEIMANINQQRKYVEIKCRFVGCCCSSPQTGHTTRNYTLNQQLENQAPNTTDSNHLYNNLELLIIGKMVPETFWASNNICNKNSSVASSWHFISTYYRRCTVETTSNQQRKVS